MDRPPSDYSITKSDIEKCIYSLLQFPHGAGVFDINQRKDVSSHISKGLLIKILANAYMMFRAEPTLLEFNIETRCTIAGDLHGYINDLICIFGAAEWPPKQHFLFLGDLVGRGHYQLDVFLLVVLLKMRWPRHVYVLRGNHETVAMNKCDGFKEQVMLVYNDPVIFHMFEKVFDVLPLAAIIQDMVFCCHGGISQWMVSRDAIRQIQRPVLASSSTVLQLLVATDLLWADPSRSNSPQRHYDSNSRGASYIFDEDALRTALRRLNCTTLVRGHQKLGTGILKEFGGRCYTIHSTSLNVADSARTTLIDVVKNVLGEIVIQTICNPLDTVCQSMRIGFLCEYLRHGLVRGFNTTYFAGTYWHTAENAESFRQTNVNVDEERHVSHYDMGKWMVSNAPQVIEAILDSNLTESGLGPMQTIPLCFPQVYDIMMAEGGSFRPLREKEDDNDIKMLTKSEKEVELVPLDKWPNDRISTTHSSTLDWRAQMRKALNTWK